MNFLFLTFIAFCATLVDAAAWRTVGSSGCTPQMVFLPPYTKTAVFIDNYHENRGGPGYNVQTGAHSSTSYVYPGTSVSVFGTEYNLTSNTLRLLKPLSNTFCSAGAFFPDGTLLNLAGAEPATGVAEGFDKLRRYAPGPCSGGTCTQDWVENGKLHVYRWYPSVQTLVDGTAVAVGGSNAGGLVLNEANINVPTYELIYANGSTTPAPVTLPILQFTSDQNLVPGRSYNLYPILHLLPNTAGANEIFTIAGNQTIIWNYLSNRLVKALPDTPLQPRAFPSSATSLLLPLSGPSYTPTVLVCGGSSGAMPNPVALSDCYTIDPYATTPAWAATDSLPNGGQTMSDGLLLPDSSILLINGAHTGSGGGFMADDPVLTPMIYNHSAPAGSRWKTQPATAIPRLYHSVATLLPSGEVLVAGSNPAVGYSGTGAVPSGWPTFNNNGHVCALKQQQRQTSKYKTEYRVEIFSPPYITSGAARPIISGVPNTITYGGTFTFSATIAGGSNGGRVRGTKVEAVLIATGFHTHGQAMGQRMVRLTTTPVANAATFTVGAPRDASVMPPGVYLLWLVKDGVPSEGTWVKLQ